jgi:uncharacterized LabA/DUF88 family protein
MTKKRTLAYVDGFNLYHAIDALNDDRLKWLNLRALAKKFTFNNTDDLIDVKYFTSYATHLNKPDSVARHKIYVAAIIQKDIKIIQGKFKWKGDTKCRACSNSWKNFEEKETDVNIAIEILSDAYEDKFDKMLLISGDSDLVPVLAKVKKLFPHKEIGVVIPPNRKAEALKYTANKNYKITTKHLQECRLEDNVITNENKIIVVPDKYK